MPSILISEGGAYIISHYNYAKLIVLFCILYETQVKCGVLLEVSTGSHVSSSARSCHSVVPIPHPYERPRQQSPCRGLPAGRASNIIGGKSIY
jgi:hypothetical protein